MITRLIGAATLFTAGSLAAGSAATLGATPIPSPGSGAALLTNGCGTKGAEGSCGSKDTAKGSKDASCGKKDAKEASCGKKDGKDGSCGKEKAAKMKGKAKAKKDASCGKGTCGSKEPKKDAEQPKQ